MIEILPPTHAQLKALGLSSLSLEEEARGIWKVGTDAENEKLINTLAFSKGIYGFGGQVGVFLYIDKNNNIKQLVFAENNESPEFFESVQEKGIVAQWLGKDYEKMSKAKPNVLSGATMTSNAINRSILKSLQALENNSSSTNWLRVLDFKTVAALLVIVLGVLISYIKTKRKKQLRTILLVLNTCVLGIWCGKFISINILLGWVSNGMNLVSSGVVFLMLLLSVILPLFFNKKSYYCNWVCPFGSAQELAGRISKKKISLKPKLVLILSPSREVITLGVFVCMWLGLASDIADYEPFSAFIFQHASIAVLLIAAFGIVSAVFISRPWCRFVCPTGQVLNWICKMD
nr:4Fe-4S binding protein [uncultured Draconibacterium sp.]